MRLGLPPRAGRCAALLSALLTLGGLASAQTLERVSLTTGGAQADGASEAVDTSLDGRYVAFESLASNLCPVDAGGYDVFVRDRATGTTILVSEKVGAPGTAANGSSRGPRISQDGRFVTFRSSATDLVEPSTSSGFRLWQKDLVTGTIEIVSVSTSGQPVTVEADFDVSATGRYVAFASNNNTVVPGDTNAKDDVFVHDTWTGSVVRASLTPDGDQLDAHASVPSISRNGRFLTFQSAATNLLQGTVSIHPQVYVKDLVTGEIELVSVDLSGMPSSNGARNAVISGLGRHVAFESGNSALYAWGANVQGVVIYVRDLEQGETWPASIAPNGAPPNNYCYAPAISDDGRFTAFHTTSSNLDPLTSSNRFQIFVYDALTGLATGVSKDPSNLPGTDSSTEPQISGDGRFVVFESKAPNLVAGDTNLSADAFLVDRAANTVFSYGLGKLNSLGCSPTMSSSGTVSASAGSGFFLECDELRNQKSGLLYYGINGAATVPFLGGVLYVAPPLARTPLLFSGGSPTGNDCTGHYSYDFNARIASGVDPWLTPGAQIAAQYWSRDPADPTGSSLSNAMAFTILP